MHLGLAITLGQRGDGSVYRVVPSKRRPAKQWDLTRFSGLVLANDQEQKLITMQVAPNNYRSLVNPGPQLVAEITYSSFKRIRLWSRMHFGQAPPVFTGIEDQPYRTLTEVRL